MPLSALIIDDEQLARDELKYLLGSVEGVEVAAEGANGIEALELIEKHHPDLVFLDVQMPGMNGIEAINEIRREFSNARFIVLTTYQGDIQVLRALKAGATGYLLKNMLRRDLLDAIRAVYAGRRYIPNEIAAELAEHVIDESLSDREVAVLRKVASGTSNKIIAAQLEVTEATVKGHLKSILSKLGANDRTHAVTIAMKRGFLDG